MRSGGVSQRWRAVKTIAWAFAAVAVAALLDRNTFFHRRIAGPIAQIDPIVTDFITYKVLVPPHPTGEVAIAAIDDQSIAMLGRFPWPRSVEARLVDALAADGAKVIAFDMFFSERDPADVEEEQFANRLRAAGVGQRRFAEVIGASGDEALARAVQNAGAVFIAYSFNAHLNGTHREANPPASSAASFEPGPAAYNLVRAQPGAITAPMIAYGTVAPEPRLNRAVRGTGYVDIDEDAADGAARSYPAAVFFDGRYRVPLFLVAARAWLGAPPLTLDLGPGGVAGIAVGERRIPVDETGRMMIHFRGPAGTLPRYSIADILKRKIPAEALRGKIVIVGVTAHALGDRFVTPVGSDFPGVELQATAIDNVLAGDFVYQSVEERGEERWAGWLLGLTVGIAAATLGAGQSLALLLVLGGGYLGYAIWRFESSGAMLGVVFPLFALFFSYLAAISYRYGTEGREKRHLRSVFELYLHPQVLASVVNDPEGLKLGGQRRHLSVLFSDIVGFTERAERLEPEPLVAMLNTYMSVMTEAILVSGGVVDKLMGDGIMAFWGPPLKLENPARAAIDCALTMLDELKSLADRDERFADVHIGIGIATGDAIVGNLGGERHFDYSAVGDTVNLASRLEGLTRQFKVGLLVNRATLEEAGPGYISRAIGRVKVKGRDQLVAVVEVAGRDGDGVDPSYYRRFGEALATLQQGGSAEQDLRGLLAERPDDVVAAMCLERLHAANGKAAGEMIFEFDTK
jgi:adenylate cyclase